ncbi:MAG TPA: ribonuclease P protein component [Alphaproteobacteria bacterium]|nr:ribonuclease P protein component [Alphaproteobacteria bacterium]
MANGRPWGRLTQRPEFLKVAASRRRWVTPGLILQVAESSAAGPQSLFRLGFTASRKVGGAVQRNRARRRLRAAAAGVMPLHAARGMDYVLVARAETVTRPYASLLGDLEAALKRLKLWREERSVAGARASAAREER